MSVGPPPAAAGSRRITPLRLLVGAVAVAAAAFGAAQALATPGASAVSTYVARGPVAQPVIIGVPKTATAKKTVRFRVGGKLLTKQVSFTYQKVTPLMTCSEATACDTAYQQLTIQPGGFDGLAHAPGADVRCGRARRGHALPRNRRLPVAQVRRRRRLHAAADRGAQHEERRFRAAGLVGVLCASARYVERGHSHRPAPAGGLSEHSLDGCV